MAGAAQSATLTLAPPHRGFPTVETLELNKLTSLRSHGNKDIAVLTFDLHADLEKAFNWNVKQLFVFVVAE